MNYIHPNPNGTYTKPILLLVDELAFSAGDFFPAILQDNNRATIFGTRTAGAGGYVTGGKVNNRLGVMGYHLTGSMAVLSDDSPIENLGVTPDVQYTITPDDYENNYRGYVAAVQSVIESMVPPRTTTPQPLQKESSEKNLTQIPPHSLNLSLIKPLNFKQLKTLSDFTGGFNV